MASILRGRQTEGVHNEGGGQRIIILTTVHITQPGGQQESGQTRTTVGHDQLVLVQLYAYRVQDVATMFVARKHVSDMFSTLLR